MVRIPEEYQEVEYIESTGTQYILTNYTPTITEDMKIEMDYIFTATQVGESMVFGSTARNTGIRFQCEYYSSTRWYIGSGINQFRQVLNRVGDKSNTRYSLLIDGETLTVDNQSISYTDKWSGSQALPMCIFAINWINEIRYLNKGIKIYKLIFTANGVKEANFIPCYRKTDNEIGMYDTVSKTFYTNSGTGTFLKGHNVYYDNVNLLEQRRKILLNTPHLETVSNNIATFNTDMNVSLKDCKIYFSPIQDGEGDPSPDNVRPISGWDGVTITRCGKNLLDAENPDQDGFVFCYLPKGTKLTYSIEKGTVQIRYYRKDKTEIDYWTPIYTDEISNRKYRDFALLEDAYYWKTLISTSTKGLKLQLELRNSSDRPTSYEPYKGSLINISFPQTIYGGYVDLIKGEIVETYYYDTLTTSVENLSAEYNTDTTIFFRCEASHVIDPSDFNKNITDLKCDVLKYTFAAIWGSQKNHINETTRRYRSNTKICMNMEKSLIGINNEDSLSDQKATLDNYLEENPIHIVYKLATPIIHSINPQTLKALKGTNNIFSNANGNIEVKFWSHLNNAYQHIPAETLTTTDDFIITTNDNYIIGNENNYIIY